MDDRRNLYRTAHAWRNHRTQEIYGRVAETVLRGTADVHGCAVDIDFTDGAPSAECDTELVNAVSEAAKRAEATIVESSEGSLGGSEDATRLMHKVQRDGGNATYVGVGGANPSGHHTARFDIDEQCMFLAIDVLTDAILSTSSVTQ